MIIDLNTINDSNAHASLVKAGYKEYCFIGPNRPDRNLLGSPLHEGKGLRTCCNYGNGCGIKS